MFALDNMNLSPFLLRTHLEIIYSSKLKDFFTLYSLDFFSEIT